MAVSRKGFLAALTAAAGASLTACSGRRPAADADATTDEAQTVDLGEFGALALDAKAWHYDAEHEAWWQLGLAYCTKPATATYEKLAIYVPGAYLKPVDERVDLSAAKLSDTFECQLDAEATCAQFTCATAPIVMPINCPGFSAQAAPTSYLFDGLAPYLSAGLVYVYAGCRGRSNGYDSLSQADGFFSGGAPWGVTDLKAAVRYLRYNKDVLPGDTERIVAFGHAAGGLLAAVMGASGNSELYDPYLTKIGAATHDATGASVGDAISAAMCWCPEPVAARADAAYEWALGQFASDDSRSEGVWTKVASEDLAASYAASVNDLSLTSSDGTLLTLDETDGGIFTDGPYFEHIVGLIEDSASSFLATTAFPHDFTDESLEAGFFPGSGEKDADEVVAPTNEELEAADDAAREAASTAAAVAATADGAKQVAEAGTAQAEAATGAQTGEAATQQAATGSQASGSSIPVPSTQAKVTTTTYASRADYINALNEQGRWITFNERRGTARIADISGYVRTCAASLNPVMSCDDTERSSVANQLFGNDDSDSLHFSQQVADILSAHSDNYAQLGEWDANLPGDWASDLGKTDAVGTSMATRRDMYDPLYFLSGAKAGFGTAEVAANWRINTGLAQAQTPVVASANLALALGAYEGVGTVDFTAVWGAGRVLAEAGGADPTQAFVSWVNGVYPAGE